MLPLEHQAQSPYSQSQHFGHGQSLVDALKRDTERILLSTMLISKKTLNQLGTSAILYIAIPSLAR